MAFSSTPADDNAARPPWLSGGLTLAFALVFLAISEAPDREPHDPTTALENAFRFWQTHGYLDPDPRIIEFATSHFGPEREKLALAAVRELGRRAAPTQPELQRSERKQLDELSLVAFSAPGIPAPFPKAHPLRVYGFTPATPNALGAISHVFLHAGWLHVISVAVLFFLLAARAETAWGSAALGRFLLSSTLFAASMCWLFASNSTVAWVGACGPVAALLALFMMHNRLQPVRVMVPTRTSHGTTRRPVEVPALAVPLVWMIATLGQIAGLTEIGVGTELAIPAIAGGLTWGAIAGVAMRRNTIPPALRDVDSQQTSSPNAATPAKHDNELAIEQLARRAQENPHDYESTDRFWNAAVAMGRADSAATIMAQQIERLARQNNLTRAAKLWTKLHTELPDHRLHANELVRIVPTLIQMGDSEGARAALRQAVAAPPREVGIGLSLRIVDLARELDTSTALAAARRTLEFEDLHETKRARIAALIAELDPELATTPPAQALPPAIRVPSESDAKVEDVGHSKDALVDVDDLAALPRFNGLQTVNAIPTELQEDVLYFQLDDGRRAKVRYEQVEAIAVAALRHTANKTVVIVDLLLNWSELSDAPLRSIRLRSDRYDPARLIHPLSSPTKTLRALLDELLKRTNATPLPDPESATGRPFRVYKYVRAYQRQVLKVDC